MLNTLLIGLCVLGAEPPPPVAPPPARQKLLIVVPDDLASLRELAAFVKHKSERLDAELLTLSQAIPTDFYCGTRSEIDDDASKLKFRLFESWKRGTTDVLLVGDAALMPVRYMTLDRVTPEAFDYAFYPCDLYYADVAKPDGSFDTWNGNMQGFHAGYFGEVRGEKNKNDAMNFDAVSYTPELALGRWPVRDANELKVLIAKTIAYEQAVLHPPEGAARAKAALFMVQGWIDAREALDGFGTRLAATNAWDISRFFYRDAQARWNSEPPSEKAALEALNGGARLVLHAGHGNDDVWEGCLSVGTIERLTNSTCPAVMMSAGCSTARFATLPPYESYTDGYGVVHKGTNAGEVFKAPPPPPAPYAKGTDDRTGLGERLLRDGPGGAVVYIGCNTGSQPAALSLMAGFVDALATPQPRGTRPITAGECWKHALAYYVKRERLEELKPTPDWYPASIYFQGMKFMYFGDPTVPMLSAAGEIAPVDRAPDR
jgi:hypothetical protein